MTRTHSFQAKETGEMLELYYNFFSEKTATPWISRHLEHSIKGEKGKFLPLINLNVTE